MKFDPSLINHQCTILMDDDEPEIILDPCHSYHNNHHHDHASKKRRNGNGNGGPMILYASYGVQGIRDSMEDSVIIYHPDHPDHPDHHHHQPHNHKNHVEPPLSYFGVFDGHGGASCSQFLSNTQLWNKYLFITDDDTTTTTTTKSSLSSSHNNNNNNNNHHHQLLLSSVFQYNIKMEQMFMDVDREYERYQHENCWVNQKIDYETDSGSTACMLFILNNNNNNNSNNNHNTTEISNELHDNDSTTIIEIQKKNTKNNNNKKKKKTKCKNNDKQATTTSTNNNNNNKNNNNKNNRAELIICNAGDSRCIIYSNDHDDTCVLSTVDHKPRSKNEKKRIESSGSLVIDDRINGDLAVSRGFGDFTFKQFKQQQQKFVTNNDNNNNNNRRHQPVIPIPDIHRIPFQYKSDSGDDDGNDDDDVINNNKIPPFVVLACDGVWDVMNNRQVIQFIVHRLKQQQQESSCNHDCRRHYDVHSIVKELVEYCVLEQKSNDNVSVMIVLLPHVTLEL